MSCCRSTCRRTLLSLLVLHALIGCAAAVPVGSPPLQDAASFEIRVRVPFVTDRRLESDADDDKYYGVERGDVTAGYCTSGFDSERDDSARLLQITTASPDSVIADLDGSTGRVVVYIHGYNESFSRNCRRAALLQRRLALDGQMLLFSWPANGNFITYSQDEADLQWSLAHLRGLLDELAQQYGGENLVVMAHSLGTRGVVDVLSSESGDDASVPRIGRVVLIAPDVERERFFANINAIAEQVGSVTVYVSDHDLLLWLSTTFNASSRLGLPHEAMSAVDDIEFVDLSATGFHDITGHLYHLYNPAVIQDLRKLLGTADGKGEAGYTRVPGGFDGSWRLVPVEDR